MLVAKDYTQKKGVDFHKVFSNVVKHSSIHILLSMICMFALELQQLDVETIFLNDELEKQIYRS